MNDSNNGAPPYCRTELFLEREVVVGEGEWALPATLTCPKASMPAPGVVLVHGSGPNDRDETVGPNKVFRDLAWGLASAGIAVLRYEKRTRQHGEKMLAGLGDKVTVKEETVDDAVLAAAALRSMPEVDPKRVFVAGHSLGGFVAPRIGQRDPSLAGLIVLAGNSRPLDVLIEEQYAYLLDGPPGETDAGQQMRKAITAQIARVRDSGLSPHVDKSLLPLSLPASYWLDLRGYDPAATAASMQMPLLIVQGERDYQVRMADFAGWKQALAGRQNVTLHSYERVNHLLMEGDGKPGPAEYLTPGFVCAALVADVAAWINSFPGSDGAQPA